MRNYLITSIFVAVAFIGNNAMAALSAVVTVSPTVATINMPVTANVAIQNTSASILNLTQLAITANYNGSLLSRVPAAYDTFNIGPNAPTITIPANGTATIPMKVIFFTPSTGPIGAGTGQYFIGANFTASDGTITAAATAGLVRVNPIALPSTEF